MNDVVNLESCIYPKTYTCPACEQEFKSPAIRKGKTRLESQDTDLKNNFSPIDPMYYDIIMCPKCGYSTLTHLFGKLLTRQGAAWLKHEPKPVIREYPLMLSAEDAISMYNIALEVSDALDKNSSEKAILCTSIAWMYRDLKDKKQEKVYMVKAINHFISAIQNERAPYSGYDEGRVKIIVGDFLRRLGKLDDAGKWVGSVLTDQTALPMHKEKAMNIKDLIREEKEKAKAKKA